MKKLFALLTVLCLLTAAAAALAETAPGAEAVPFALRNNITFGMTTDQVIAAEGAARYERDTEHTDAVTFEQIEYDDVADQGYSIDLEYYFVNNELVAMRGSVEKRQISWQQAVDALTERYGEPAPLDATDLGKAVYALDDDGRPEPGALVFTVGDVRIVLEQDEDDIDVTFLDMAALYVR